MKFKLLVLSLAVFSLAYTVSEDSSNLKIGDKAPMSEHLMKDVSGVDLSLNKMRGENGLLVIFSCNTCPFVVGNGTKSEGWENRYNDLATISKKIGVGMVMINSNEAKRDQGDSFKDMVKRAEEKGFMSYYTMDNGHEIADAFGAKTTPHVFLFDGDMSLIYQGAIDDNANRVKEVEEHYLQNALSAISNGEEVQMKETKPVGCSIKRVSTK